MMTMAHMKPEGQPERNAVTKCAAEREECVLPEELLWQLQLL